MWIDRPEDEEQAGQAADAGQGPSVGAGAGAGSTTPKVQGSTVAATGTPSSMSPTAQAPGQQFGTIQDYFKGSKQQGEKFGEQFSGKLADTAQQQKDTIGQAADQATSKISDNTLGFDQGLVEGAVADPTAVANNDDKFNAFSKQWNAAYRGPESFQASDEYGAAAKAAGEAKAKQGQVETVGGRQQLVQDEFGVYGQGNRGLDEALLQQSSYFPKVQDQAKEFGTIQNFLGKKTGDVNTAAKAAKETTAATKENTQKAFDGSLTGFQKNLTDRTAAAQGRAKEDVSRYSKALASGDQAQIDAVLNETGVDAPTASSIREYLSALNTNYGVKPEISAAYIGNPNTAINNATVAETADYNKSAALEKLTGKDYSGVLNQANIGQAGTGKMSKHALKGQDLKNYLQSGLSIQDKSLLSSSPKLDWAGINDGKVDPKNISKQINDIIAAGKRQNVHPRENTALQGFVSNGMQGVQAIILGGENIQTRPALKTYTDAVVNARSAAGENREAVEKELDSWIGQLAGQVGRQHYPVYGKPDATPPKPATPPPPVIASPGYTLLPETPGRPREEVKKAPEGGAGTGRIRPVPTGTPATPATPPAVKPGEPTPSVNPGVAPEEKIKNPTPVTVPIAPPPAVPGVTPRKEPTGPSIAKNGKALSDQIFKNWQTTNKSMGGDKSIQAKNEASEAGELYELYLSKDQQFTTKNYLRMQELLKKHGISI